MFTHYKRKSILAGKDVLAQPTLLGSSRLFYKAEDFFSLSVHENQALILLHCQNNLSVSQKSKIY